MLTYQDSIPDGLSLISNRTTADPIKPAPPVIKFFHTLSLAIAANF